MNNLRLSFSQDELSGLRAKVEAVGKEIGRVRGSTSPGEGPPAKSALDTTWADLVQTLDLGPEPAMRSCPYCHAQGMAGATLCGRCWSKLPRQSPQADVADTSADGQDERQRAGASG